MSIDPVLAEVGASLASMAVKGTASAINKKIRAGKEEKNIDRLRETYDEIISELLQEREEAIRIAQIYKSEIERIEISDEDIVHLHETATRLIEIIKAFLPEMDVAGFEMLKDLLNVDTLKTMQLLGFNYKSAIGEPLTQVCAEKILSLNKPKSIIEDADDEIE